VVKRAPHLVALVAVAALAFAAGCQGTSDRTSQPLLSREIGLAYERAFQAHMRMTTQRFDEYVLAEIAGRCAPVVVSPADRDRWEFVCGVAYRTRRGGRGGAAYAVEVDRRGCFVARSRDYPGQVFESVLRRPGPNPLARIRSCP
jgi:hypothetical protein